MSNRRIDFPAFAVPMGKVPTQVKLTIFALDRVCVEFAEYELRKVKYRGSVSLRRENGHFTAKLYEHRFAFTRIDRQYEVDGVSDAAKGALIRDAGEAADKVYAEHFDAFLEAEVARANDDLRRAQEREREAREALHKAQSEAQVAEAALDRARAARMAYRKK